MVVDLQFQPFLVACHDGHIVGFVSFYVAEAVAWIGWLGVSAGSHRSGIGRALLARLFEELHAHGVPEVRADTLGDSVDHEPYARTRAFYAGLGFTQLRRVRQEDPEWPDRLTLSRALASPTPD